MADRIVVPAGGVWSRRCRCAPRLCHLGAHGEGQPLARAALRQRADAAPRGAERELKGFSLVPHYEDHQAPKSFL